MEYENEYEILEKKLNEKETKLFNIYDSSYCLIATVNEEELNDLTQEGIIKETDIIEEAEYGYNDL